MYLPMCPKVRYIGVTASEPAHHPLDACYNQLWMNLNWLTSRYIDGLYIGKGCFYYLPTNNLLVGWQ
jgi:hypothetical protein